MDFKGAYEIPGNSEDPDKNTPREAVGPGLHTFLDPFFGKFRMIRVNFTLSISQLRSVFSYLLLKSFIYHQIIMSYDFHLLFFSA